MASAECSHETKECTRRVFEAVNQNSVSLLQSARKTYSEIQLLTSLAECNEEGETPLAIAIKNRNIVENEFKLTFVINQLLLQQIPIKELIDVLKLIDVLDFYLKTESTEWLMFIAKIFLKSNSLTRQDTIILLELIGSVIITQLCDENFEEETVWYGNCGLECWRKAMTLRYFPTDGGSPLPKLPNVLVPSVSSSVIFESAVEVATIEELDLLQEDFERNSFWSSGMRQIRVPCVKRLVIQALLFIRRISDQEDLGHPHWLYLQSLFDLADVWRFENYFGINLYLFILEELNGFDPNLFSLKSFNIFIISLDRLSNYFVDHLREPSNSPRGRELNYANLLMITKWINSIQLNPDFQYFECQVLEVVYRLVFILNSISSRITSEEQKILKKFYCDYLRNLPERTTTVLHEAVSRDILHSNDIPNKNHARLQTIKRLLQFGADPNAIDGKGQTPLHRLAETTRFNADESIGLPLFQVLLDAGAHIDAAGDDGKTALCILKEILWSNANGDRIVHPYFESLINSVFPLSCYCARVIRRHGVPFEDRLPPRLKKLVSSHSAKASIDLHQPPPEGCNNNST